MVVIKLNDTRDLVVDQTQGLHIYRVLQGLDEPANEKAEKLALATKKIHLNWRNAPDYYLLERKDVLIPIVLGYWMRLKDGDYVRPEWGDEAALRASKVLGLWEHGKPTALLDTINRTERYRRAEKLKVKK